MKKSLCFTGCGEIALMGVTTGSFSVKKNQACSTKFSKVRKSSVFEASHSPSVQPVRTRVHVYYVMVRSKLVARWYTISTLERHFVKSATIHAPRGIWAKLETCTGRPVLRSAMVVRVLEYTCTYRCIIRTIQKKFFFLCDFDR